MDGMVERVARAIAVEDGWQEDEPLHHHWALARAAIAAMRKPTDAMLEAAFPLTTEYDGRAPIYQVMIDAALKEP